MEAAPTVEEIREACGFVNANNKIFAGPNAKESELRSRTPIFRHIVDTLTTELGVSHQRCVALQFLGDSLMRVEEFAESKDVLQKTIEDFDKLGLTGCNDFVWSLNKLIDLSFRESNFELADEIFDTYAKTSKSWRIDAVEGKYFFWFRYYEYLRFVKLDLSAAADAYSRVYEGAAAQWGQSHPQHFVAGKVYWALLIEIGEFDLAEKIGRETIAVGKSSKVLDAGAKRVLAEFELDVHRNR